MRKPNTVTITIHDPGEGGLKMAIQFAEPDNLDENDNMTPLRAIVVKMTESIEPIIRGMQLGEGCES